MKFPLASASPRRQNCGHASDRNVSSVQVPRASVPMASDGCVVPVYSHTLFRRHDHPGPQHSVSPVVSDEHGVSEYAMPAGS
jgi:hypothetical protein